jgi:glucokinase
MKRDVVIAVDLGGTNLRLGVVSPSGRVLAGARAKMGSYKRNADLLTDLYAAIADFEPEASARGRLRAVCLGFAGYTDSARGLIYFAPNVGGLRNIRVGPYLKKRFNVPVFVENDANCAALGEHYKGAGRNAGSLFMFTLGTGVGGGFIVDGKIWRGARGTAGEIGHTIVMVDGPLCSCGNRGCLETFASATAIVKEYRRVRRSKGRGRVAPGTGARGKVTARQVTDLARRGDRAATAAMKYAARGLGVGIANIFNLLDPELILIGGGVSRAGAVLLRPAIMEARKIVFPPLAPRLRVRRAVLGDDAALIGAARFAFEHLK